MRLSKPALADHHNRAALVGADGFDTLQKIVRGISDFQELLGGNLSRTGMLIVRQLDGRTFETLASEFLS